MSIISKQWLQQKIADMEAARDEIPFGLGEDDSNTLAALRIALASLEAEEVAWRYRFVHTPKSEEHGSPFTTDWVLVHSEDECNPSDCFERQPLYTAPPAPISVPDEVNVLLNHLEDVLPDEAFNLIDVKTWNNVSMLSRPDVYRAAMLQGAEPVSNRDELPDGWVACSERMPDNRGKSHELYLCWGTYFDGAEPDYIPALFFIHPTNGWCEWEPLEDDCDPKKVVITHWMPLPAAPQQEA